MTYFYMGNDYTYDKANALHRSFWYRYWTLPDINRNKPIEGNTIWLLNLKK